MKVKINKTFKLELSADQIAALTQAAEKDNYTPEAFLRDALSKYIDTNFLEFITGSILKNDKKSSFLDKCDCIEHGVYLEVSSKIPDAFSWPKQVTRSGVTWNFMNQYGLDLKELGKYTGKAVYIKDDDTKNPD